MQKHKQYTPYISTNASNKIWTLPKPHWAQILFKIHTDVTMCSLNYNVNSNIKATECGVVIRLNRSTHVKKNAGAVQQ